MNEKMCRYLFLLVLSYLERVKEIGKVKTGKPTNHLLQLVNIIHSTSIYYTFYYIFRAHQAQSPTSGSEVDK